MGYLSLSCLRRLPIRPRPRSASWPPQASRWRQRCSCFVLSDLRSSVVSSETAVQIAFAAGVVVLAATIATALAGRGSRRELAGIAGLLGLAATGGWVVFALDVDRGTAVAAGGLTVCFAAAVLTLPLRSGLARTRRMEAELEEAETALRDLVERETVLRGEELERTLARARAETSSRLAEDERKLAEARRNELAQRERRVAGELGEALALVERRVEQRLAEWSGDLDRIQQGLTTRLAELAQRQREAVGEAQSRLETEMEQLKSASEDQRAIIAKRREIDQLTRIVDRTANRLSEAAVEQFSATVKTARDDAAKRLSRELDRAVAQFAHDAQSVLAERLAQVSDAGAARVDRKLAEIVGHIEQRRDEFLAEFQRRFSDVEAELRSQIRAVGADAEAEREVLEARVHDLTRRLETAVNAAESSLEGAFRTP